MTPAPAPHFAPSSPLLRHSPSAPDERDQYDTLDLQQSRTRSYLKLLCGLFGIFFITDSIERAITKGWVSLLEGHHLAHLALVAGLLVAWRWARRAERTSPALMLLETLATLGVAAVAVVVVRAFPGERPPPGPLLALNLSLVARAAIVPSSGRRTLLIGAGVTGLGTLGYATGGSSDDDFWSLALVWLTAFSLASAYVSRVIYGLQQQVRKAQQLGQYLLEEKLGGGGMGVVYRAQHRLLRRPTAVKLISPDHASSHTAARFEQEVRQTARLAHPNTVTIYDYGCTRDGVFYYAMELLEGATLSDVVAVGGPLPAARAVQILAATAGALAEAHGIGLIHRDIKPANIMLCEQGGASDVTKVLDFGLVKDLEARQELTQTGAFAGTPAFMAPESIRAPESVSAQSDLYGLGAVAYFLLTGRQVFEARTVLEVCSHHLLTPPTAPSTHCPEPLPPALEALVLECLEKAPERRPGSALELEARLRSLEALGTWTDADARSWWATHRESLRARRSDSGSSPPTHTVAIDLRART